MSPESEIILRTANPDMKDGRAFAGYLDQAAEGFFKFMLGQGFIDVIADAFTSPAHDFSYENVVFAVQDGTIVGAASGFTARQHRHCSDEVLSKAKGFPAFRMFTIQLFFGSVWRFLDSIDDGDFYLQSVAVAKEMRGKGVGSRLIDFMESRALENNAQRFVLDVAQTNAAARRLYERRGMAIQKKWPKHVPLPRFRILRMAKAIVTPG